MNSQNFREWCSNIQNFTHYFSHSNEMLLKIVEGMEIDINKFKI
jgi:uncharacterized protein YjlB